MILNKSAFSLLEIVIVVTVIAILSVTALNYYQDSLQDSRIAVVKHNLKTVREAISMYFKDHMCYPTSLKTLQGPYLKSGVQELLIYPLKASASVFVEVPTDKTVSQAFQATETELIYYKFDGTNTKEIKNVKIKYDNHIMTW